MKKTMLRAALLATVALTLPTAAFAQQAAPQEAEPPADAPSPDDPSLQAVPEAEANANAAEAQLSLLQAQIEALQGQIDDLKKQSAKSAPGWKGAPQWADANEGFSFKVRGRFMMDTAYMGTPDNLNPRDFGFNTRIRRVRLGVEGTLPGDFGYKAEMDFANGSVGFGDVLMSWNPGKGPMTLQLGNMESLDGMEQMTSSRWSSFIERAQVNDAFGNTRRLGMTLGYKTADNLFRIDAGLFAAHSIDASLDNKGWIAAARATYAPQVGPGFVHLGLNFQHRKFQENNGATALTAGSGSPSTGQLVRYRARPFLQTTGTRFVDTNTIAAESDNVFGVEAYGVFKSLHVGGEMQLVKVNAFESGDIATGRDQFSSNPNFVPNGNPSFWGGHFEVGYFLTGETRGYKNGLWDRTKVLNPYGKGGFGALQLIGRIDYLDLNDDKMRTGCNNNFATGACAAPSAATLLGKGGRQIGYLAGLTWIPNDYVRFLLNYIHTEVKGGPSAATVEPTSSAAIDKRSYSTDAVALRAQFDF